MDKQFIVETKDFLGGEAKYSLVKAAQVSLNETCSDYPIAGFYATETPLLSLSVPNGMTVDVDDVELLLEYEDRASEHLIRFRECSEYCPNYKSSCAKHCTECFIDSCYGLINDYETYVNGAAYGCDIDDSLNVRVLYLDTE